VIKQGLEGFQEVSAQLLGAWFFCSVIEASPLTSGGKALWQCMSRPGLLRSYQKHIEIFRVLKSELDPGTIFQSYGAGAEIVKNNHL